jgi:dTDP-4-dehydrorhamnose 3,5-epimerase
MKVLETEFNGLLQIFPEIYEDQRGYFIESFHIHKFQSLSIPHSFVQDNFSYSQRGVIRGLHLQLPPYQQAKLVMVMKGKALDVVVDLRTDSPTYGQHAKYILNAEQHNMLYIPEGFAHGLLAIEETIFTYKCSDFYNKSAETGILWKDDTLNIDWELDHHSITQPIISDKDQSLPTFEVFRNEIHAKVN